MCQFKTLLDIRAHLYDPNMTFSPSTSMYLEHRDPGSFPNDRASPEPPTVRTRIFCKETPAWLHISAGLASHGWAWVNSLSRSYQTSPDISCITDRRTCQVKLRCHTLKPQVNFSQDIKGKTETLNSHLCLLKGKRKERDRKGDVDTEWTHWEEAFLCRSIELQSLDLFSGCMNVHL